jgi:hypothetical protein
MILVQDLQVLESLKKTDRISGAIGRPTFSTAIDGFVIAGVAGQVSGSVTPKKKSYSVSYGTAGVAVGAVAGAISVNGTVLTATATGGGFST